MNPYRLGNDMEITRTLAKFIVNHRAADVPEKVRHEAARSFLNWTGCAVGACRHETVERALAALDEFSGPRVATVLGRGDRLDVMLAALINGTSSHTFDFDDTHLKTIIHPSGPVASAILALAEKQPVKGEDFLHAFILGVETECRIGNAVYPAHYDVGWHITATAGVFGAAAAAGRLLGLTEQQMVWALGIAATQASGLREMFGTMVKPMHPGNAARNGLLSAFLAAQNFTSAEQGIEGRRAFANVLSTTRNYDEITGKLGETWEAALNTYKPFACGIVEHPIIDGCVQLRNEHNLKAEDIESIALKVHPLVLELTGKRTPQTGLESKFSVFHSAAVGVIFGAAGEEQYSDGVACDSRVMALRDKVTATVEEGVHEDQARIAIRMKGGRTLEKFVEHAVGSLDRPMSDADLEAKFHGLADGILSRPGADRLIRMCWNVGKLKDAGEVARASVPAGTAVRKPRSAAST